MTIFDTVFLSNSPSMKVKAKFYMLDCDLDERVSVVQTCAHPMHILIHLNEIFYAKKIACILSNFSKLVL